MLKVNKKGRFKRFLVRCLIWSLKKLDEPGYDFKFDPYYITQKSPRVRTIMQCNKLLQKEMKKDIPEIWFKTDPKKIVDEIRYLLFNCIGEEGMYYSTHMGIITFDKLCKLTGFNRKHRQIRIEYVKDLDK